MDYPFTTPISLTAEQQKIANDACEYVKKHKKEIIERFAGDQFPSSSTPLSFFMAGSPGAGKTEFSKRLIANINQPLIRIDGDEIRQMLPGYTGSNSFLFQHAISIGVSKLHDYALQKSKEFILDATFSDLARARENIKRSIAYSRSIVIIYIYQDPIIAWKFTQKREALEGRNIPKYAFLETFFSAKQVVQSIKDEFDEKVRLWLIEKNLETNEEKFKLNIDKIDSHLSIPYSREELERML